MGKEERKGRTEIENMGREDGAKVAESSTDGDQSRPQPPPDPVPGNDSQQPRDEDGELLGVPGDHHEKGKGKGSSIDVGTEPEPKPKVEDEPNLQSEGGDWGKFIENLFRN